jgi:uncharacterized membrane protein YgdD (TMEM256/DUF423 family)
MPTEHAVSRRWLAMGAFNGFLAVALGAFAAHGLQGRLSTHMLGIFEKGVEYHGFHALALLITGLMSLHDPQSRPIRWAGVLFLTGILLFSGSLYVLALSGIRSWGAVTPFGGAAFLLGWTLLGLGAVRLGRG